MKLQHQQGERTEYPDIPATNATGDMSGSKPIDETQEPLGGVVIDVVQGAAGMVELVFSRPDGVTDDVLRMDLIHVDQKRPGLRRPEKKNPK